MKTLRRVRRALYVTARVLGDVQAMMRGPGAMARRAARKAVLRRVGGKVGRL